MSRNDDVYYPYLAAERMNDTYKTTLQKTHTMASEPLSPTMSTTSSTRTRPGSRNTGFPEPFCGQRNTTLPHPDADLSPNATLSFDDIDPGKILARTRRSFLAKKKKTIRNGKITDDDRYPDLVLRESKPLPPPSTDRESLGEERNERVSKESTDSMQSHEPSSPTTDRKRNVLRKLWMADRK